MNIAEQLADEVYGLQCDIGRLEAENTKLRDLMYERAHVYAIQHMTEAELRIVATNVMEENAKLREVASLMAAHYLPNNLRMPPKKWRERDRLIREMLGDLEIEVKE